MRRVLAALLVCAYAPYAWLLGMDYPWSEYRWLWFKMWPILLGLLPRFIVPHTTAAEGLAIMAAATGLILALAIWSARRSRRALFITAGVLLTLSLLNSWGAYRIFRA